jgi:hypothetical protein
MYVCMYVCSTIGTNTNNNLESSIGCHLGVANNSFHRRLCGCVDRSWHLRISGGGVDTLTAFRLGLDQQRLG